MLRTSLFAVAALLAGCSNDGAATADGNRAEAASAPSSVTAEIDFANPEGVAEQAERLAAALQEAGRFAYVDLTIIPAEGDSADSPVSQSAQVGAEATPVRCESAERLEGERYSIAFNPHFNHLLLTVLHGDWREAPLSTVACINRASRPAFNVRGYYAISSIEIPTANDVELRPLAVPPRH